jgi:hypothetical protein
MHRAFDREWGGLDQLRPVVDAVERVEVGDARGSETVTSASNSQ